jgi:hypothetical protein
LLTRGRRSIGEESKLGTVSVGEMRHAASRMPAPGDTRRRPVAFYEEPYVYQ